jgi:hypothetical protein
MNTLALTQIDIPLKQVVVTKNALATLTPTEIESALARHSRGDWGDLCPEDAERNIESFHEGSRILSAYGQGDRRFWIITSGDLRETTVLLPSDY